MTKIDANIDAKLVWDGNALLIPSVMGAPAENQMQGTDHERLSEICCRTCYDSLGRGRGSIEMHKHLLEVAHWSVYEHARFTVELPYDTAEDDEVYLMRKERNQLAALINRPGLYVSSASSSPLINNRKVTLNYRHLLDWDRWSRRFWGDVRFPEADRIFDALLSVAKTLAPQVVQDLQFKTRDKVGGTLVEPEDANEKCVTLFLSGSRGLSHEQVRHRFSMSQRSTRYCDESGSPWVEHPLVSQYLNDENVPTENRDELAGLAAHTIASARSTYDRCVARLESYLIAKGIDKQTSRKQARGAARGYLGNALYTELMFSASVTDWRDMLALRHAKPADAEIRAMYGPVLAALKASRYGEHFEDMASVPSPDGLGTVLEVRK
jgi:thymidylate synthase ThyX